MWKFSRFAILSLAALSTALPAFPAAVTFAAATPSDNTTARTAWLSAIGIVAPEFLVDFEVGYSDGQNIDSVVLANGFFLDDTSTANTVGIECNAGGIGDSNPVGNCAAEHNERQYLFFDFSANPVDYVGFLFIDSPDLTNGGTIFFVGGGTQSFTPLQTGSTGNTAEFFGVFRNDMPKISSLRIDVGSGDDEWAVDNIEFGSIPTSSEVPEPATFALTGCGLVVLALVKRRRSQ